MGTPTYIYGLVDPRTGVVRYVGKSGRPRERLTEHLRTAELGKRCHRDCWIRSLKKMGLVPGQLLIESCYDDGSEAERRLIAELRLRGNRLTNETDGGDGIGLNPSSEIRQKMSEARKNSAAAKESARASLVKARAAQGGTRSTKWRQSMSAAMKGRAFSPEWVAKMAAARRGKPAPNRMFSATDEEAICAAYRAGERTVVIAEKWGVRRFFVTDLMRRHGVTIRPHSLTPEQVEKMRKSKTGQPQKAEHIAACLKARAAACDKRDKEIATAFLSGQHPREIAAARSIDRTTVYNALKRQGITPNLPKGPR